MFSFAHLAINLLIFFFFVPSLPLSLDTLRLGFCSHHSTHHYLHLAKMNGYFLGLVLFDPSVTPDTLSPTRKAFLGGRRRLPTDQGARLGA